MRTWLQNKYLDAVCWQFMRISGTNNAIAFNARVGNLSRNIAVRQANNQTIFRCIVLVLILENQAFPSIVVGLSLTSSLEFHLITLKVLFVLHNFNETLREKMVITDEFRNLKRNSIGKKHSFSSNKSNLKYAISFFRLHYT